jgi:hypothetical protein
VLVPPKVCVPPTRVTFLRPTSKIKKYLRRTGEIIATIISEHFYFSDPGRKTYTLNWRITILHVILKECGNCCSNLQKEEIEATLERVR